MTRKCIANRKTKGYRKEESFFFFLQRLHIAKLIGKVSGLSCHLVLCSSNAN